MDKFHVSDLDSVPFFGVIVNTAGTYTTAATNAKEKLCMAMHRSIVANSINAITYNRDVVSYVLCLKDRW